MAKKSVLSYEPEEYYVEALRGGSLTSDEMRREYARLRKIALARFERLEKSPFVSDVKALGYTAVDFARPSSKLSERDLMYKLYRLSKFVQLKRSTITGNIEIRNTTLSTLRERGYGYVNKSNYSSWGEFWRFIKSSKYEKLYGSQRIADTFDLIEKRLVSPEEVKKDFEWWMENERTIENLPKKTTRNLHTLDDYKRYLGGG